MLKVNLSNKLVASLDVAKVYESKSKINCISFDDTGTVCVTTSEDDSIHIYDCVDGNETNCIYSKKYGIDVCKFGHNKTTGKLVYKDSGTFFYSRRW